MAFQNSDDVFHVTFSRWKVWLYSLFCWGVACLPLLGAVLFAEDLLRGNGSSTSLYVTLIFGAIGLLFAAIPFIFLKRLSTPLASFTHHGFSRTKALKLHSFAWTPNTVVFSGYRNLVLANLDASQSRASKLWRGPKDAVLIGHALTSENQHDVLKAIDRLSHYPVERTSIWRASMF